ncbi:hypothetical protein NDU88_008805 [Pleurodeles waltl]|uniref:Uncharacterized protein n=1 Tax=Pleurodeles waltl TaxID=8319 RepID=A0AAV7QPP1_PLEWA|nr:hypothetical protein NDU88_008805 [Pleurodeles waltl]
MLRPPCKIPAADELSSGGSLGDGHSPRWVEIQEDGTMAMAQRDPDSEVRKASITTWSLWIRLIMDIDWTP